MVECLEIAKNIASANKFVRKEGYSFYAGGTEICRLGSSVKNKKFVSLKKVGLDEISIQEMEIDGKTVKCVKIGAMCTFTDVLKSGDIPEFLKKAAMFCSSMPKRNMATIGGNVMADRDDSYLVSAFIACGAYVEIMQSSKAEVVSIEELLSKKNLKEILLLSVIVKLCSRKVFLKRYANTASSHSSLVVAFGVCSHDGKVKHPVFAASIKGTGTVRIKCAEKLISDKLPQSADIENAVKECTAVKFKSDIFGSAEYKKHLLSVTCADLYSDFIKDSREDK